MHQHSATPTPPARRYNVRKRGADVTLVSTHQRDPVSHSEQELPVARKATRYSSDTEEFKYIPASPEVGEPVVKPEYVDTQEMKYVPASPGVEDLEATPPRSGIVKSESRRPSEFEELDADLVCSDAKQAPSEKEAIEATPDLVGADYSSSTRNTPVIEDLDDTPRRSDTKERRSISTPPKDEERDATNVAGDAEDHVSDTEKPIYISSSPEAEERNATHASGDAEDQDSGTKALPDGVYEIEGLRGKQWSAGKLWLHIKWKTLPTPSWELAEHMRNELGEEDYQELLETMPRKRRKKAPKW
jgi:hypothetical protein